MALWDYLRTLWRHQPVVRTLVLLVALLSLLEAGAQSQGWKQQAAFLHTANAWFQQAQARLPEAPPTPPRGPITWLNTLGPWLWVIHTGLLAETLWVVRLAYPHLDQPVPWRRVWGSWLAAFARGMGAMLLVSTALTLLVMPVVILGSLAFFLGGWPTLLCLGGLLLAAVVWALPWVGTFLVAAVVEHPANPIATWRAFRATMRRNRAAFRLPGMLLGVTLVLPWLVVGLWIGATQPLPDAPLRWLDAWSRSPVVWVHGLTIAAVQAFRLLLYGGWAGLYLEQRPERFTVSPEVSHE